MTTLWGPTHCNGRFSSMMVEARVHAVSAATLDELHHAGGHDRGSRYRSASQVPAPLLRAFPCNAEYRPLGRNPAAVRRREMAGDQQAAVLAAFFEDFPARGASLVSVGAGEAVRLPRNDLQRMMHRVPGEDAAVVRRLDAQVTVAWRMSRRRHDRQAVAHLVLAFDDLLAAPINTAYGRRFRATPGARQCTAAYMILASFASAISISSTIRPCRATRMRSDSARISGI